MTTIASDSDRLVTVEKGYAKKSVAVHHVDWMPDGKDLMVATGAGIDTFRTANVAKGLKRMCTELCLRDQKTFAISPSGGMAATPRRRKGSTHEYEIEIIDATGRAWLLRDSTMFSPPSDMEFDRSGSRIIVEDGDITRIWTSKGTYLGSVSHMPSNLVYDIDGREETLYTPVDAYIMKSLGHRDRTTDFIERSRLVKGKYEEEPEQWVRQSKVSVVRMHPHQHWLAAYGDNEVRTWETPSGRPLHAAKISKPMGHCGDVETSVSMDFNAKGDLLAVGTAYWTDLFYVTEEGGLKLKGRVHYRFNSHGAKQRLRFSPTGDRFYYHMSCGEHGGDFVTVDVSELARSLRH